MEDVCKAYRNDEADNQMVDASIIRPMNGIWDWSPHKEPRASPSFE